MDESEFIRLAEQTLQELDRRIEASGIDADCEFKGAGVLEIEFGDGSKIIVNSHAAAREIWVAAKSGGYHFRGDGRRWVNSRDGTELFAALSAYVSQQAGKSVNLTTDDG
jgi:CyaY protein